MFAKSKIDINERDYLAIRVQMAKLQVKKLETEKYISESEKGLSEIRSGIESVVKVLNAHGLLKDLPSCKGKGFETVLHALAAKLQPLTEQKQNNKPEAGQPSTEQLSGDQQSTKQSPDEQRQIEQLLKERLSAKQPATKRKVEPADPHHITI